MNVLVLTTFEVDEFVVDEFVVEEFVVEELRAGASGFLGKGVVPAQLLDAIRLMAAAERRPPP